MVLKYHAAFDEIVNNSLAFFRIMGLDGQSKMSKSTGNTIGLLESRDEIWAKLRPALATWK